MQKDNCKEPLHNHHDGCPACDSYASTDLATIVKLYEENQRLHKENLRLTRINDELIQEIADMDEFMNALP